MVSRADLGVAVSAATKDLAALLTLSEPSFSIPEAHGSFGLHTR
jgi:hypothetical protein